ncbi:C40 family peptidase [Roseitranquillus sediminis]|uniref:C40 family peptidase n=1 Tax=Roseitranquillus sediminis TaxID=2809051 RepID=UPI001D0C4AAF|nr:NlpC/P60 family protein [Roseitranquillus sediminis]MBM9593225.1 C40 family peptidase [Roseitranquillus sediminis]
MGDRRLLFANERVAAEALAGQVESARLVRPEPRQVAVFATFLHARPDGARDRQILLGDQVEVIEEREGWSFARVAKDGYVGYVATADLAPRTSATHAVTRRHTHLYPEPDLKLPPVARLPFGGRVAVEAVEGRWARTAGGFLPDAHLRRIDAPMTDPLSVAEMFLGTPYLWAGNTGDGIDCSGLVQVACLACGIACPGDSDQQEQALGTRLPDGAPLRRGDLIFWRGHVGWLADTNRLLHANAHAMAVTFEPLAEALARIEAQGDGPVTSLRRLATGDGGRN